MGGDHDKEHNNWVRHAPVYVTYDLGIIDPTFAIWFQMVNGKFIILREYINTEEDMAHYSKYMRQFCSENKDRPRSNPAYEYDRIIVPHDARRRTMEEGKPTPESFLLDRGWSVIVAKSRSTDDIVTVREIMNRIYINTELCPLLHKAFLNYRYKQRPDGTDSREPIHDEHSHPMDSLRYGVTEMYNELLDGATPGALDTDERLGNNDEPAFLDLSI